MHCALIPSLLIVGWLAEALAADGSPSPNPCQFAGPVSALQESSAFLGPGWSLEPPDLLIDNVADTTSFQGQAPINKSRWATTMKSKHIRAYAGYIYHKLAPPQALVVLQVYVFETGEAAQAWWQTYQAPREMHVMRSGAEEWADEVVAMPGVAQHLVLAGDVVLLATPSKMRPGATSVAREAMEPVDAVHRVVKRYLKKLGCLE